jgi:hypothetical protein
MREKFFMVIALSALCVQNGAKLHPVNSAQGEFVWLEAHHGRSGCGHPIRTIRTLRRILIGNHSGLARLRGSGPKSSSNANQDSRSGGSGIKAGTKEWALLTQEKKKEFGELAQVRISCHMNSCVGPSFTQNHGGPFQHRKFGASVLLNARPHLSSAGNGCVA